MAATTRGLFLTSTLAIVMLLARVCDTHFHFKYRNTTSGVVKGYFRRYGTIEFLGIPYAKPPEGALRFLRPVPVDHSPHVIDADDFSEACPQDQRDGGSPDEFFYTVEGKTGFNCLTLNIWQPLRRRQTPVPVIVFIHGGSFVKGSSSLPLYHMGLFARVTGLVVVTINYRVGLEGFLYIPGTEVQGNMGLWDQRLALQWIQDNIEIFGGDPSKVTLMGQSAGAISTSLHMASNHSQNLFKRAIIHSGTGLVPTVVKTPELAAHVSSRLAQGIGCTNTTDGSAVLECFQSAHPQLLIMAMSELPWGTISPTQDGEFISQQFMSSLKNGDIVQTDVMVGGVRNEMASFMSSVFSALIPKPENDEAKKPFLTEQMALLALSGIIPNAAADVLATYSSWPPFANEASINYYDVLEEITADLFFKCSYAVFGDVYAAMPATQMYAFEFTSRPSTSYYPDWMGIPHLYDIVLLFGFRFHDLEQPEKAMVINAMKMWGQFAKSGNPTLTGSWVPITWSPYLPTSRENLQLTLPKHWHQNSYEMTNTWEGTLVRCQFLSNVTMFD